MEMGIVLCIYIATISLRTSKDSYSHYWIHPCYMLVKWRRGRDYSAHFIKEKADTPREYMDWPRAYCESFICSKPCWTEISPTLSLYLLVFTYRFLKRKWFRFAALCLWFRPDGQCPGRDMNWWCCPRSHVQTRGSWQLKGENLPAIGTRTKRQAPASNWHLMTDYNAHFQCALQYPLSLILQLLHELGIIVS